MKKMNKQRMILTCLSLSLIAGTTGALCASPIRVNAETLVSNTMLMEKGASLYLNEVSGLKFSYTVSDYDATADKTYGMLIVPYDYLDDAGITDLTNVANDYVNALETAYAEGKIANAPIVQEIAPNANGVFSHSIGGLQEYNYAREFFGIGFEKTGEETYLYATQHAEGNVRSVFEVANLALNKLNYGTWDESNADEMAEKTLLANNEEEVLNPFITKALGFVYGEATPTVQLNAIAVNGETTPVISATKEKDIELAMHWNYASEDEGIASIADGKIKGESRGQTKITASHGKAISLQATASVLKKEMELTAYHNSGKADFFKVDGKVSLTSGAYNNSSSYSQDTGYVAILNSNSEDGKYTLDNKGTYVDFYFTGNNMPNVEFFGNTISGNMWSSGENKGFVVSNGIGPNALYSNYEKVKGLINTEDVTNSNLSSSYKFNGLVQYENYFKYGVSNYAKYDKGFNNLVTEADNTVKMTNYSTGSKAWKTNQNQKYSNFSMWSLMQDETQEWHYNVGLRKDDTGAIYAEAKLYKVTSGEETLFAEFNKQINYSASSQTIPEGETISGYIVAHSAIKGSAYATDFAFGIPYAGEEPVVLPQHENATFNADGTVSVKNGVGNSSTLTTLTSGYVVLDEEYQLGECVDIYFTGDNMPWLSFFATEATNLIHNSGSGFVMINGLGYQDENDSTKYILNGLSKNAAYGYELMIFAPNRGTATKIDTNMLYGRQISSSATQEQRQEKANSISMYKLSTMPDTQFKMTVGFYENASGMIEMSIYVAKFENNEWVEYYSLTKASKLNATTDANLLGNYLVAYGAQRNKMTSVTLSYSNPFT